MRITAALAAVAMATAALAGLGPETAAAQAADEPVLALDVTTGITAHQQIVATVTGLPDDWRTIGTIAVCEEAPTDPGDSGDCTSLAGFGPIAATSFTVPFTFRSEAFATGNGFGYCGDEPFDCTVVASLTYANAAHMTAPVPIDVDPRPLVVAGGGLHDPASPTEAFVVGEPNTDVRLGECVSHPEVPQDVDSCRPGPQVTLSATGRGRAPVDLAPTVTVDGTEYDCARFSCQLKAFDGEGDLVGVADLAGSLVGVTLTAAPTIGLTDHQAVTVTTESVTPGYASVSECVASVLDGTVPAIDGCTLAQSPDDGATTWTFQVRDTVEYGPGVPGAPDRRRPCDADPGGCVLVANLQSDGSASWYVPIDFTPPSLAVTPASGLQDGQPVGVTGADVPESYDGPRIWFVETGEWVLAECGAAIADDPTLLGVFTHCGTSVGGPAAVDDFAPYSQDTTVDGSLEPILGGSTDCTAGPGTCVMALLRMERTGKVTVHTAPLSFA